MCHGKSNNSTSKYIKICENNKSIMKSTVYLSQNDYCTYDNYSSDSSNEHEKVKMALTQ